MLTLSVLQNDESVLSALLSAAVLSRLDLGIELGSLPVSLTICVTNVVPKKRRVISHLQSW